MKMALNSGHPDSKSSALIPLKNQSINKSKLGLNTRITKEKKKHPMQSNKSKYFSAFNCFNNPDYSAM